MFLQTQDDRDDGIDFPQGLEATVDKVEVAKSEIRVAEYNGANFSRHMGF